MNRSIDSLRVRRNAYRHKGVDARRKDAVIVVVVAVAIAIAIAVAVAVAIALLRLGVRSCVNRPPPGSS